MANVKISGLPTASTPLTGAELVPVVQSGVTSQTTVGNLGAAVSYTPSGTGAVATTVQAKLRETVSVKDFGAVGDGVTDDTAAIQNAFTYAGTANKAVYIPEGTYLAVGLTLPYNVSVYGDGYKSIIKANGNGTIITVTGSDVTGMPRFGTIKYLQLNGSREDSAYSVIGLEATRPCGWRFYDLSVRDCTGVGVKFTAPWDCSFFGGFLVNNDFGYREDGDATHNCNNTRMIGVHFESNRSAHFYSEENAGSAPNLQLYISECKLEGAISPYGPPSLNGIFIRADDSVVANNYLYLTNNVPIIYMEGNRNRIIGNNVNTPGNSNCIKIDGDKNVVIANTMTTNSSVTQLLKVNSGNNNVLSNNTFTIYGGGTQSYMDNLGTSTFITDSSEYTFTPGVAFGGAATGVTYAQQVGLWQRVNNKVFVSGSVVLSNKGSSSGNATIGPFPIAAKNTGYLGNGGVCIEQYNMSTISGAISISPIAGSQYFNLLYVNSGNTANVTNSNFTNTSQLYFNFCYEI